MTNEEIIDAMNNMKKAHAVEVLAKLDELAALVNSKNEIWSYGLPPSLTNILNILLMQRRTIETDFGLVPPTVTTPV